VPGVHTAVLAAAVNEGIPLLAGRRVTWLSGRGHLNKHVAEAPADVLTALATMHSKLGGDAAVLAAKRAGNPPTPDLVHTELGCFIEIDEVQHFTTARLRTLDLYPVRVPLGFDIDEYRRLIGRWREKGDRAFAHRVSADFPKPGGRQAQRAYNDALRDLLAPTYTGMALLRIPAPDSSPSAALARLKHALRKFSA
jgi:hypothetical protein